MPGASTLTAGAKVDVSDRAARLLGVVDVGSPGVAATSLGKAEDATHVSGDTGIEMLGVRNDNNAVRTAADGKYSAVSTDSAGRLQVGLNTAASTGRVVSTASTNATVIKASAGQLYGGVVVNTHATQQRFLKIYDKATAPTVGTDTPIITAGLDPVATLDFSFPGINFVNGIAIAITALSPDTDTTATGAGDVIAQIFFK